MVRVPPVNGVGDPVTCGCDDAMGADLLATDVTTKDCSALGDAELSEMADLTAGSLDWEVGRLGKEVGDWVLASMASRQGALTGFLFTTLERIGGTPALLVGAGATARGRSSSSTLRALLQDQYHRALMAFPDEDVLVAARVAEAGAMELFSGLADVRPAPGVRVNGEERAWGRRLAKRYDAVSFDDRSMVAQVGEESLLFDHRPNGSGPEVDGELFASLDAAGGRHLVAWGWARAEFLERHG